MKSKLCFMLLATATLAALTCTKKEDPARDGWKNPVDPDGDNFNPPVVRIMDGGAVPINDTITIFAEWTDKNGVVVKCFWALDSGDYDDTTVTCTLKKVFPDTASVKIKVKAIDDHGLFSLPDSNIIVVTLSPPTVTAMDDSLVPINDTIAVRAAGVDSNGVIEKYYWALDGNTFADSTDSGFIKTVFLNAGTYTIKVKVRDDDGLFSLVDDVDLTVILDPPTVTAMGDRSVPINDTLTITAAGSDANGTVEKYYWALDGQNYDDSTDAGSIQTVFTGAGDQVVKVMVRDDDGLFSDPVEVTITVTLNRPQVTAMADTSVSIYDVNTISAAGTDSNGIIEKYYWALDGQDFSDSTDNNTIQAAFDSIGSKTVYVKVRDDDGLFSDSDQVVITVRLDPPSVQAMDDTMVAQDKPTTITAAGTDPNGTVEKYYWALDGTSFNDSTTTGQIQTSFSSIGNQTVLVKVRDDDGVFSDPDSTVVQVFAAPGMVYIPGNTFQMGSDFGGTAETPVHAVTLLSFWIDSTEVTQADYEALMTVNPSRNSSTGFPVENLTWYDAVLYCNARSNRDGLDTVYRYTKIIGNAGNGCQLEGMSVDFSKRGCRLPTEAEWEYAYRGVAVTRYPFGDSPAQLGNYSWYYVNAGGTTHPVAQLQPNQYGLYDMGGNVWEWVHDWYSSTYYSISPQDNPTGPGTGIAKILRGGSKGSAEDILRSAFRDGQFSIGPEKRFNDLGFRVVLPSE